MELVTGHIRDSHPLRRPVPRDLNRCRARNTLYKLQLGPRKRSDFKFELLPLHSPLLRQSLLVSFPPLIDMLKFSGYPCLIRGQFWKNRWVAGRSQDELHEWEEKFTALEVTPDRHSFSTATAPEESRSVKTKLRLRGVMTLEQACPPEYQRAQCAFKDSMIH